MGGDGLMKNVRIDENADLRCWNCGSKGFTEKRTTRSKVAVGVGTFLTKKKLKCQSCGEYNDTGNAQPFTGPEGRKYRKRWEKEQANNENA
jgi:DNA-directed RNA polymerase subunit RPC12/RpoP